jgi:hypothetical protein
VTREIQNFFQSHSILLRGLTGLADGSVPETVGPNLRAFLINGQGELFLSKDGPVLTVFSDFDLQSGQSLSITDWVCRGTHRFDIFVPVVLCCFIHWCRFTLAVL